MKKYSFSATWNNLTPFGRVLLGSITALLILGIVGACLATVAIIALPTPTPTAQATPTFTFSPSPNFTPLPGPSLTPFPTRRVLATYTPFTELMTPTKTINPVAIPSITLTATAVPRNKRVCNCTGDKVLTCASFLNQKQAQACYDFCFSQGAADVFNLDENHDGIACNYMLRPPKTP